jgi:hypothetical protein
VDPVLVQNAVIERLPGRIAAMHAVLFDLFRAHLGPDA